MQIVYNFIEAVAHQYIRTLLFAFKKKYYAKVNVILTIFSPDMVIMCALVELERRHFPELFNQPGEMVAPTTKKTCVGRKHIPHGYGDDDDFVPHGRYVREEHVERYCLSQHATQHG